jgi:hypothetical protein
VSLFPCYISRIKDIKMLLNRNRYKAIDQAEFDPNIPQNCEKKTMDKFNGISYVLAIVIPVLISQTQGTAYVLSLIILALSDTMTQYLKCSGEQASTSLRNVGYNSHLKWGSVLYSVFIYVVDKWAWFPVGPLNLFSFVT